MNSNSLLFYGESKHYIDIPSAFGEAFITCPGLVPPMMKYPGAISCVLANLCTASSEEHTSVLHDLSTEEAHPGAFLIPYVLQYT